MKTDSNIFPHSQLFALYSPEHFAYILDVISDGTYLYALFKISEDFVIRRYDLPKRTQETWEEAFEMFEKGEFGERILNLHKSWQIILPRKLKYFYHIDMDFTNQIVNIVPHEENPLTIEYISEMGWTVRIRPQFPVSSEVCRFPLHYPDILAIEEVRRLYGDNENRDPKDMYFIGGVPRSHDGLNVLENMNFTFYMEEIYPEYKTYIELSKKMPITIWKLSLLHQPVNIKSHESNLLSL